MTNHLKDSLIKIFGWIYIGGFVLLVAGYFYGLLGALDRESFHADSARLQDIANRRCAIQKYISVNGELPASSSEVVSGFGDGISYRPIQDLAEQQELICRDASDEACKESIGGNGFYLYELCADFQMSFGGDESALIKDGQISTFSDYCKVGDSYFNLNVYYLNPKHPKGQYCYIFYSPKDWRTCPAAVQKLNSFDRSCPGNANRNIPF